MSFISYESVDNVAIITICRPKRLNALNNQASRQLAEAFRSFQSGTDRAAVLTGEGDRAFSAGADVDDLPALTECIPGLGVQLDKPFVAAVSGYCVGAGLLFVMAADLCVATHDARFIYPEAKLGISGGMVTKLVAQIPHKIAMELILLGEPLGAQRAYEAGLVNRVVDSGQHVPTAAKLARTMAGMAPLVVRSLKLSASALTPISDVELAARTKMRLDAIDQSADFHEGMKAYAEKRKPVFQGR